MKNFIAEFKKFIRRGSVMDMAIGIIIGGAFTNIVTSLVEDIITPIIGLFGSANFDAFSVKLMGKTTLKYGHFFTQVINFLIMALVIFLLIRAVNRASDRLKAAAGKVEEEAPVTTKICPYCKSEICIDAVKCPHCTSDIRE